VSKTILIHGFAVGLTTPIFRPGFGVSAGFSAWKKPIAAGEAAVFYWGINRQVNLWQILNPFFLRDHYEDEKILAQATETFERLKVFLEQARPTKIVCHSMGGFLLNQYCKKFSLPSSVQKIFLVQGDLSIKDKINFPVDNLSVYNIFCPWDPTLLISWIYNRVWRVGLGPIKVAGVQNIFFPLWRPINFHTSGLRDDKLVKLIEAK
jgi:hypothetical protein